MIGFPPPELRHRCPAGLLRNLNLIDYLKKNKFDCKDTYFLEDNFLFNPKTTTFAFKQINNQLNNQSMLPLFLGNFNGWEWAIVILVVLLLFGGKKIPELMRGIGKGITSFKQGLNEAKEEMDKAVDEAGKDINK